jgi:hypothetical protein
VTGPTVLRVLAVPQVVRNATHEMSHAISLRVNPTLGNRPRWLWESVALFENDELVDPKSIPYLAQGRFPTLAELDADPSASRQVYEVGYLIGEFVVARAGTRWAAAPHSVERRRDGSGVRESRGLRVRMGGVRARALLRRRGIDTRRGRPIDLLVVPPGG